MPLSQDPQSIAAELELCTERLIHESRERLYAAFIDPVTLALWWGPHGFTNHFTLCDVRPGGQWRYTMRGPDGSEYPNESEFVELSRPSRIVVRHKSEPRFTLTVSLLAEGDATRLEWRMRFETAADCARVRKYAAGANEQNIDRLIAVVERGV